MNPRLAHVLAAAFVAALLAGCASDVKLDDVLVEDRGGVATAPAASAGQGANAGAAGAAGSAGARSGVAPVDLGTSAGPAAGPTGVGKLIYFDYDSFVIKPEFQAVIDAHARYLKADAKRRIAIEGHTDERGGREYNLALGQKRAEAVRRALGLLGVADGQMEAVSFGKEKPAATGSDEAALARNRRAELVYR